MGIRFKGLLVVIFFGVGSVGGVQAEERLLRGSQSGAVRCCASRDSKRCLEILTRGENADEVQAACAAQIGASAFADLDALQGRCSQRPDPSLIQMPTSEYSRNGWQQSGPADQYFPPMNWPKGLLAINSEACNQYPIGEQVAAGWEEARSRCTHYENVHLHISMANDHVDTYSKNASQDDGWLSSRETSGRVYSIHATSLASVQAHVAGLLKECKVIQYVNISSHGAPGYLLNSNSDEWSYVTHFLRNVLTPCALAPGAKVQFAGCSLACGQAAEAIREGLGKLYLDPRYQTGSINPLFGVQLLMNTDTGWVRQNGFWDRLWGKTASINSENNVAIEYTVGRKAVESDIPTSSVSACQKSKKDKVIGPDEPSEDVLNSLRNP